jgi:hypothetical protein
MVATFEPILRDPGARPTSHPPVRSMFNNTLRIGTNRSSGMA